MKRTYPSGAVKKKLRKETLESAVSGTRNVHSFFETPTQTDTENHGDQTDQIAQENESEAALTATPGSGNHTVGKSLLTQSSCDSQQNQQNTVNIQIDEQQWKNNQMIDKDLEKQAPKETIFWRKVLHRLVTIIFTLCTLCLPLRGHHFNGLVLLLAQYDDVLKQVLALPDRSTKYLSWNVQNEIITLMSNHVKNGLISKINASPFFSIIADSTTDIAKAD